MYYKVKNSGQLCQDFNTLTYAFFLFCFQREANFIFDLIYGKSTLGFYLILDKFDLLTFSWGCFYLFLVLLELIILLFC